MPRLNVTVHIQGRPAKRLYVQHIWSVVGVGAPIDLYITDDNGRVRDEKGRLGINSTTTEADIRILAQNPVVRMVSIAAVWPVYDDKKIKNGTVVNIDNGDEHVAHFRILEMAMDSYDQVHRHFEPFAAFTHAEFPFSRKATLEATRDQNRRIDIVYPDNLPQPAPFVEPKSIATGYPLVHLKDKNQARNDGGYDSYNRLFGVPPRRPEIVAHELAHAIHFSLLSASARKEVQDNYVKFLIGSLIRDGDASHNLSKNTTPLVAYIEAFGAFSERASAFVRYWAEQHDDPDATFDVDLAEEFIKAETTDYPNQDSYWLKGDAQIAKIAKGSVIWRRPAYTSLRSEGAIYGAIFLDFANQTSMEKAVKAYYESQALNFTQYEAWVKAKWPGGRESQAIVDVARRWELI